MPHFKTLDFKIYVFSDGSCSVHDRTNDDWLTFESKLEFTEWIDNPIMTE